MGRLLFDGLGLGRRGYGLLAVAIASGAVAAIPRWLVVLLAVLSILAVCSGGARW
jgi:hypothetical protein